MPGAVNSNMARPMPPHGGQYLDWKINVNRKVAPHNGATDSFTYIAPVSKYVEAYALGPTYISYWNYNHGNQPYDRVDNGANIAFRTPTQPNFYMMAKVSPKSSAYAIQIAQQEVANLLQYRTPIPPLGG